jgi:UDP-N-acetylmuramyl pentapeptide synthase
VSAGSRAGVATHLVGFAYDSRIVAPGELLGAVVTPTGDGHDYIAEACRAGAAGVLCSRVPPVALPDVTIVQVADTQEALAAYARYILARRRVEVIGVTGSVGKTSTKEAIAAVLAMAGPVVRSQGNYNGRFGLSIALGGLGEDQHLAVLEMAADGRGEIADLAAWTRPRVGVVTRGAETIASNWDAGRDCQEKGARRRPCPPTVWRCSTPTTRAWPPWRRARWPVPSPTGWG